jgi:hypothetical protein
MRGVGFDFDVSAYDLTNVILTKTKFSCGYAEKGYVYRIETTSKDGVTYRGNWGYPDLEDLLTLEVKRFEGKDKEIVLLGVWKDAIENYEGVWLFRLNP